MSEFETVVGFRREGLLHFIGMLCAVTLSLSQGCGGDGSGPEGR